MPKPKLSISLPSIYEPACIRTLKNLRDATRCDYEVIMISPFAPPKEYADKVVWIEEKKGTGTGCNAGHAKAFEHMTGDYVMAWVDDHILVDGFCALAVPEFEEREKAFQAKNPSKPFMLGLRHVWPRHVGTQFGIYYPYFPMMRRETLKTIGWYDPLYKKDFADGDLAFRVWAAGGRCEWSSHGLICVTEDDNRKDGVIFEDSDMELFIKRWAPKLGRGWDVSTLRGFNMDVVPEKFPAFVKDNSIYENRRDYRADALASGWLP